VRRFALLVSLASLVLALPAAAQQACSDFELVGFTSTTHLGTEGVLGFTLACQADYADSRMCTSVEVMQTVNVPAGMSGEAWVRPVFLGGSTASGVTGVVENLTCGSWSGYGDGSSAMTVNSSGGFYGGQHNCLSTALAVACCAAPPSPMIAAIVPISSPVGRMMMVIVMMGAVGIYWTRRDSVSV
jgi:hypothetical protein